MAVVQRSLGRRGGDGTGLEGAVVHVVGPAFANRLGVVFDNSLLADDAARQADIERRRTSFTRALQNMKILAGGGTLPPPAPRGGGPGRGGR